MEHMPKRRLFHTVMPVKEKDLYLKVFLFVAGTGSLKLSEDEGVCLCSKSDRDLGPPSEREQGHRD